MSEICSSLEIKALELCQYYICDVFFVTLNGNITLSKIFKLI